MKLTTRLYALIAVATIGLNTAVASDEMKKYRVTITNATTHHVITPPLIIIHNEKFKLFEVTGVASEGLAIQAETGSPSALAAEVTGAKGVYQVIVAGAPIIYGNKASFEFKAPKKAKITVTGMLATTNDALTAILGKSLPKKSVSYLATTYDAGSEDNNELCIDIPGPPCGGTNAPNPNDGEGFISIHSGISGVGDLVPAMLDWRGATSIVTITRIKN